MSYQLSPITPANSSDLRKVATLSEDLNSALMARFKAFGSVSSAQIPQAKNDDGTERGRELNHKALTKFFNSHIFANEISRAQTTCKLEEESWGLRYSFRWDLGFRVGITAGKALVLWSLFAEIIHASRCEANEELRWGLNSYSCVKYEGGKIELRLAYDGNQLPSFKDGKSNSTKKLNEMYESNRARNSSVVAEVTNNIVTNQPEGTDGSIPF